MLSISEMDIMVDTWRRFPDVAGSSAWPLGIGLFLIGVALGAGAVAMGMIARARRTSGGAEMKARELAELQEQLTITNEELRTSKEEMEIGIEELNLVNEELRSRNEELNELNNELLKLRHLHDQIFQVVPAAILTIDEDLRIASLNDSCRRLSIWRDSDRGEGDLLTEVLNPRFVTESDFASIMKDAFASDESSKESEVEFADDDGDRHFFEITVCRVAQRPVEAGAGDGGVQEGRRQVFFVIREVSALKKLSSEIEMRDRLMEEMKVSLREQAAEERRKARKEKWDALREVSSAIAADMKHVLGGIEARVSAMRKKKKAPSPADTSLDDILEIAGRGMEVVARIEKEISSAMISSGEYSLDDAVEEALGGTMVSRSRRAGIDLRLDLTCGQKVRASRESILECLHNIVENAIESMPGGGVLEINTMERDGFGVALVRDHGRGMDSMEIREAFEPYFSTRDEEGAGLGLSIVRSIVQRVGGKVEIESAKGKGTTVELRFPIANDPGSD